MKGNNYCNRLHLNVASIMNCENIRNKSKIKSSTYRSIVTTDFSYIGMENTYRTPSLKYDMNLFDSDP